MKNQQQVLLALLLLALTSMSAVAGGMNVAEPFFDENPEEDDEEMPEMPEMDEQFAAAPGQQVVTAPVDEEPKEAPKEGFVQNAVLPGADEMSNVNAEMPNVEGFTGGMYAGF